MVIGLAMAACGGGAGGTVNSTESTPRSTTSLPVFDDETDTVPGPPGGGSECQPHTICETEYELAELLVVDVDLTNIAITGDTAYATTDSEEVIVIDLEAGEVTARHPLGVQTIDVVVYGTEVWLLTADGPLRLDPGTGEVLVQGALSGMADPTHLAVSASGVWVSINGTGELALFDGATGEQVLVVSDYDNLFAPGSPRVAAVGGFVWVIDEVGGRVLRVDPSNGVIVDAIDDLGHEARVDGASTTIVAPGPVSLVEAEGALWVLSNLTNPDGEFVSGVGAVYRVDPGSIAVELVVDLVGDPAPGAGFAVTDDAIWYIEYTSGELIRVDRATGLQHRLRVADSFYSGNSVAVSGGKVYVTSYGSLLVADVAAVAEAVQP